MNGFPRHINTRADVEHLLQLYPGQMKAKLKEWLEGRYSWLPVRKLSDGETGQVDDMHRVVEVKGDMTSEITERYQEAFQEDPNCYLFRLGISVQEAEVMLKN